MQLAEWLEELKSYKEAEEQGLLVRLPCPVGTTVWDICGMIINFRLDLIHVLCLDC